MSHLTCRGGAAFLSWGGDVGLCHRQRCLIFPTPPAHIRSLLAPLWDHSSCFFSSRPRSQSFLDSLLSLSQYEFCLSPLDGESAPRSPVNTVCAPQPEYPVSEVLLGRKNPGFLIVIIEYPGLPPTRALLSLLLSLGLESSTYRDSHMCQVGDQPIMRHPI